MKLNLDKCNFGVLEGKFIGFYMGKAIIRPNPRRSIEAIINTTPLRTIREMKRLDGKINALRWFILKNAKKCKLFFQLLKVGSKSQVNWTT